MKNAGLFALMAVLLIGCGANSTEALAVQSAQDKMFDCARQVGISGQFFSTLTVANGAATSVITPGNDVTPEQAEAANRCIAAT